MKAYQIRVHLAELPTVWRRIIVPSCVTFPQLHLVIQFAMGWDDMHLYEFWSTDDPTRYTDDQESITYMYDFGDSWEHILEEILPSHANVPLAFRTDIDAEAISITHLYKYFKDFLAIIKESEPLKLTAKGNLPAKLVATLSA